MFSKSQRNSLPKAVYPPHIVMDDDNAKEYLGVTFYDLEVDNFNQLGYAFFTCLYQNNRVAYYIIQAGNTFCLMEGKTVVAKRNVINL